MGTRGRVFRAAWTAEGATAPESLRHSGPRGPIDTLESGLRDVRAAHRRGKPYRISERSKLSGSRDRGGGDDWRARSWRCGAP